MASSVSSTTTLSTLCRGTGFVESGGPKVMLQATEMTLIKNTLERKTSNLRWNRERWKRAALPQTYSTRRGIMLLYPNSILQKKDLLEGRGELGEIKNSILADSNFFSAEFEKWINSVVGESAVSSSDEDEARDVLTDLAGNKPTPSQAHQNPLPVLLSADNNAFLNSRNRKIRPGLSARRYLINLTEGAESKLNCNWKGKGYVSDSTFFEANAANPELKRKVKADLSEMPEPYSLSHFLSPALPFHFCACDYALKLPNEVEEEFDMFASEGKEQSKKDDQGKAKEKDHKKDGTVTLPQIKKAVDYAKFPIEAKRALLVDRLIRAAISLAIRKHKELFESFLKSQAIIEENKTDNKKRIKFDESSAPIEGKPPPWLNFNDALTAISSEQQSRREQAKAKIRGRQGTQYDGNSDSNTAPFSTYLRPRLLGGGQKPAALFRDAEKTTQPQIERHFEIPPRNESDSSESEPNDDEILAPALINYEHKVEEVFVSPQEQAGDTNVSREGGGSVLGRLFAEGASPEMKRILQSIPAEIYEAIEEDLVQKLAKHASRIAKTVLAKPGNGKILDKDVKLALDMWTKFLLEPIPQPPSLSKKHTTSFSRGESHSLSTSSSQPYSSGAERYSGERGTRSSNFDLAFEQNEQDEEAPVAKQPKQPHPHPVDFGKPFDSLPEVPKSQAHVVADTRSVTTKEFKGAFDNVPHNQLTLPPVANKPVSVPRQLHAAPKNRDTEGGSLPNAGQRQVQRRSSEPVIRHKSLPPPPINRKFGMPPKRATMLELPTVVAEAAEEQQSSYSDGELQEEEDSEQEEEPILPPAATIVPSVDAKTMTVPTGPIPVVQTGQTAPPIQTTASFRPVLIGVASDSGQKQPLTATYSIPTSGAPQVPALQPQTITTIPTIPAKFAGPTPVAANAAPASSLPSLPTASAAPSTTAGPTVPTGSLAPVTGPSVPGTSTAGPVAVPTASVAPSATGAGPTVQAVPTVPAPSVSPVVAVVQNAATVPVAGPAVPTASNVPTAVTQVASTTTGPKPTGAAAPSIMVLPTTQAPGTSVVTPVVSAGPSVPTASVIPGTVAGPTIPTTVSTTSASPGTVTGPTVATTSAVPTNKAPPSGPVASTGSLQPPQGAATDLRQRKQSVPRTTPQQPQPVTAPTAAAPVPAAGSSVPPAAVQQVQPSGTRPSVTTTAPVSQQAPTTTAAPLPSSEKQTKAEEKPPLVKITQSEVKQKQQEQQQQPQQQETQQKPAAQTKQAVTKQKSQHQPVSKQKSTAGKTEEKPAAAPKTKGTGKGAGKAPEAAVAVVEGAETEVKVKEAKVKQVVEAGSSDSSSESSESEEEEKTKTPPKVKGPPQPKRQKEKVAEKAESDSGSEPEIFLDGGEEEVKPEAAAVPGGSQPPPPKKQPLTKTKSKAGEKKKAKGFADFDIVLDHLGDDSGETGEGEAKGGKEKKAKKQKEPKEPKPPKEKSPKEKPFTFEKPIDEKAKFLPTEGEGKKKKGGKKSKKKKNADEEEEMSGMDEIERLEQVMLKAVPEWEEKAGQGQVEGGHEVKEGEKGLLKGAVAIEVNFKRGRKEQAAGQLRRKPTQMKLTIAEPASAEGQQESGGLSQEATAVSDVKVEAVAETVVEIEKEGSARGESARSGAATQESEPDFIFVARSPTQPTVKPPSAHKEQEEEEERLRKLQEEKELLEAAAKKEAETAPLEPAQPTVPIVSREEMMKRKREAVEAKRRERMLQREEELRLQEEQAAKKDDIQREIEREAKAIEESAKAEFDRRLEERILQAQEEEDRAREAAAREAYDAFMAEQERLKIEDMKNKFQEELKRRRTSRAVVRIESTAVQDLEKLFQVEEEEVSDFQPVEEIIEEETAEERATKQKKSLLAHKVIMEARRKAAEEERRAILLSYQRLTRSAVERQKLFAKRLEHWGMLYHQIKLTRAFVWSYFELLDWLHFSDERERLPAIF